MRAFWFYLPGYWKTSSNFRKVGSKMLRHQTLGKFNHQTFKKGLIQTLFFNKETCANNFFIFDKNLE
jgi:hypothetical protein